MPAFGVYNFRTMAQTNQAPVIAAVELLDASGVKSGPPELARAIRLMIRDGEYGPGDRLGTAELADRLNVSRGPVREALRLLESRRLVRIEQNRGAFVIDLQDKEALDAFATRGVLFAFLAELTALRANDAQIAAMQGKLAELSDLHSKGQPTPRSFLKATFRIVQIFHEAAATPHLTEMILDLTEGLGMVFGHFGMATRDMRAEELRGYRQLLKAIANRDPARSFTLARQLHSRGVERGRALRSLADTR